MNAKDLSDFDREIDEETERIFAEIKRVDAGRGSVATTAVLVREIAKLKVRVNRQ